mgnify:CR=1 FL=1
MDLLPFDIRQELFGNDATVSQAHTDAQLDVILQKYDPDYKKAKKRLAGTKPAFIEESKIQETGKTKPPINEKIWDHSLQFVCNKNQVLSCSKQLIDTMREQNTAIR